MEWPKPRISLNAVLLCAALVLGAVAYWGVDRHIKVRVATAELLAAARFELTPVVVAARTLSPGAVLTSASVAARPMPRAFVAADSYAPDNVAQVLGRKLRQSIRAGDALTPAVLEPAERPTFSEQVQAGARAVTVPVDEVSAFNGLLAPGDHVDLLYSHERAAPGGAMRPAVRLLLAQVPVLATGRATRRTRVQAPDGSSQEIDSSFSTATLSVTPYQAQLITLAQRTGELVATLRHPADTAVLTLSTIDARALEEPPPAIKRAAHGRFLELILGGRGGVPDIRRIATREPASPPEGKRDE
jgi:pilus assembly protein CpaB